MIHLTSDRLSIAFEPEQGGKWRSLLDRRTGREWLWSNPHLSVGSIRYGDSYIEKLDTGGWDEIFPSVDPCGAIPDHGDLVQLPWQVDTLEQERLLMSVEGRCYPSRFERDLRLDGATIRCDYHLRNLGDEAFSWLWCAHPLLPLSPDLTVEADCEFEVLYGSGAAEGLEGQSLLWNELPSSDQRWAAKLFSKCGAVETVTMRRSDGSGLRMKWNPQEIPYLGLWVNNGGWSGCGSEPYFNLGVEPATLPVDNLSETKNPSVLAAGESAQWSLDISIV